MTIAAILKDRKGGIESLHPDSTVAEAVALLAEKRIGAAPVLDGDRVVGIFSERDVIHCLQSDGAAALDRRIADVMTTAVKSVGPNESAIGALSLMTQRRIRHLPVIDGDTLVGFVSIGDLVKYRIDRIEADAAAMREYIQSA
ncbi:CBS domain-containing protein [Sphingomonas sp. LB2R24]|jgi:CBS domain-containing protein|uniref:CBS domain-containing protein n=1 Tax=Sphingomonas TaxID=13687 RepID=UPI001048AAD6|nr:CBS domain-containing protein [Sphingomonas sp. PP-F2F-A104-K0414]TCP95412.1 CBS domain-containing protein [Sphingomonas sp. PP-F2F-A104-K0414]